MVTSVPHIGASFTRVAGTFKHVAIRLLVGAATLLDFNAANGETWAMEELAPGMLVRNPEAPDWGLGQVQSVIGNRVTVNFENAGKQLINSEQVTLEPVDDAPGR
jgi:hypothetical protein